MRAAVTPQGTVTTGGDQLERFQTVYASIRPILLGVSAIPLIPSSWRKALTNFLTTADEVTAAESFKAGKDLAIADLPAGHRPKPQVG